MKVFISWSGDRSKAIGSALRIWLPQVIQSLKPFFTPDDIEKGQRWSREIFSELETSTVGLFCVTPENKAAPWLLFEAGAISKPADARACPILFDMGTTDLTGPLAQLQLTIFSKDSFYQLIQSINLKTNSPLDENVLRPTFDRSWPDFEKMINDALRRDAPIPAPERTPLELQKETLELVRSFAKSSSEKGLTIPQSSHLLDYTAEILNFSYNLVVENRILLLRMNREMIRKVFASFEMNEHAKMALLPRVQDLLNAYEVAIDESIKRGR